MEVYRGDIFYVHKYGQVIGSEQEAGRPAVIVSNNQGNKTSNNVTIVYLTSQVKKPMTTHCDIVAQVKSTALCETITSVSKDRLGNYLRTCTAVEMKRIDECVMIALGINSTADVSSSVEGNLIDDLKMKLDEMTAKYENEKGLCDGLQKELAEAATELEESQKVITAKENALKLTIRNLKEENDELQKKLASGYGSEEFVRMQTTIDVYKQQNEMLLEKLIG